MRRLIFVLPIAALNASLAHAQAINIDLGPVFSSNPVPSSAYGAASGQTGYWNAFASPLLDISGNPTAVNYSGIGVSRNSGLSLGANPNPDEFAFMTDFWAGSGVAGNTSGHITLLGIQPGQYKFYVYGWHGANTAHTFSNYDFSQTGVGTVGYALHDNNQAWTGQVEGKTYFTRTVTIASTADQITISMNGFGSDEFPEASYINGIQIVPVPAPGAAAVFGAALLGVGRRRR